MNKPLEAVSAPKEDGQVVGRPDSSEDESAAFAQFWCALRERQDTLLLIRQLSQMIYGVQLHRGMSMSLLAGSSYFEAEMAKLETRLCHQLTALEAFAEQTGELLNPQDKEILHQAWHTITHDWRHDAVLDNFELHSHFIEALLAMIARLSTSLHHPLPCPVVVNAAERENMGFRQLELVNFVAEKLPRFIEQLAKLRGLSSHTATLGRVDFLQERKLRYLIQGVKTQNNKLRHQAERLMSILDEPYQSLGNIKTYEIKLLFLFGRLEDDLLSGDAANVDGPQLFKLASEIMTIYAHIMEDGWNLLRRWVDVDAECWIYA